MKGAIVVPGTSLTTARKRFIIQLDFGKGNGWQDWGTARSLPGAKDLIGRLRRAKRDALQSAREKKTRVDDMFTRPISVQVIDTESGKAVHTETIR